MRAPNEINELLGERVPASAEDTLEKLTDAVVNFSQTTVLLAALTAVAVHAVFELGGRGRINRFLLRFWLYRRNDKSIFAAIFPWNLFWPMRFPREDEKGEKGAELAKKQPPFSGPKFIAKIENAVSRGKSQSFYNLPHPHLCAQLSTVLSEDRDLVEDPEFREFVFSDEALSEPEGEIGLAERTVEELQIFMEKTWTQLDYVLSICTSWILIALIAATPNDFSIQIHRPSAIVLAIAAGFAPGFVAPIFRRLVERVFYWR